MTDPFVDDLLSFGLPVFAVLDGAIVDDIERFLKTNALAGRPLFRERMDREMLIAGPWLVPVGMDGVTLHRSVEAARDLGKGVFWLGAHEEEVMFTHLRKLNAARMPDGRVLFFRHYDSDVLVAVAPLLGAGQAAQLFGPSEVLGFVGGEGDGLTIEKPDGLPDAAAGPMQFEPWQLEELNERQRRLDKETICRALRSEYPELTRHLNDADLKEKVLLYEQSASELDITSRPALLDWARLNMESNDGAFRDERLKSNILGVPAGYRNKAFVQSAPQLIEAARRASDASAAHGEPDGRILN